MATSTRWIAAAALLLCLAACGDTEDRPEDVIFTSDRSAPAGLPNYKRWSEGVASGGRPAEGLGIRNLAALGFHTIVCVEAAEPDVEGAAKFGMKTVHVPLGYKRIDAAALLQLAQAVHGASRLPAYYYCDDGTRRGPMAAQIARKSVEELSMDEALRALQDAKVPLTEAALYQAVRRFRPPTEKELAAGAGKLPSRVTPSDVARSMGEISARAEQLARWAENGWERPAAATGLGNKREDKTAKDTAAQHAKRLATLFRALKPPAGDQRLQARFEQHRGDAEAAAHLILFSLNRKLPAKASQARGRLMAACDQCHRVARK